MGPKHHHCSLVVVDDDPTIRSLIAATLAEQFEIRVAETAEEGEALLGDRPADILFTDLQLPGRSGVELAEAVRARWPTTVRLLMTAAAKLDELVDAINRGEVRRFLFKPFNPNHLRQVLREEARQFLLERSHESLLEQYRQLNLELEQRVQDRTREVESAYRQLQQKNLMLHRMALTDPLTGLPNRRGMDRLVTQELMRRTRTSYPFALAMIDIDHFKQINTRHLLSGGDHALGWVSRLLSETVRTVDAVGRVGGEEFMLVAPETDAAGAAVLAERLRRTVAVSSTEFNGEPMSMTISVGLIAVREDVRPSYEEVRHAAAAALNDAKQGGRNRCVIRELTPAGLSEVPAGADAVPLAADQ